MAERLSRPTPCCALHAALDAAAASRVASFVLRLTTAGDVACDEAPAAVLPDGPRAATQYIIVSHRAQVFERAACLVGVYGDERGGSAAIVARM